MNTKTIIKVKLCAFFLLNATIRGLLVESPEVLSVPRMLQGFSLFCLKFVVAKSDYSRYHIGSFLVWS